MSKSCRHHRQNVPLPPAGSEKLNCENLRCRLQVRGVTITVVSGVNTGKPALDNLLLL